MTNNIKTLKIIHFAICSGVIFIYFFIGEITMEKLSIQKVENSEIVYFLIPILAIVLGNLLFKSQLKQADPNSNLEEYLPIYQTASIIRWAILEGAAFFILFLKNNLVLLGIIIIAYLIYLRPTMDKIESDFSKIKR